MRSSRLRQILLLVALTVFALLALGTVVMGPRNLVGMLRYDQRREGRLQVGDAAPDVELASLDSSGRVHLAQFMGGRPLVLVFGSYT